MFMGWTEHNAKISKESTLRTGCQYFEDKHGTPKVVVVAESWMETKHPEFPDLVLRLKDHRTPAPQEYLIWISDDESAKVIAL